MTTAEVRDKRTAIIESAARLFRRSGYHATSLGDVCEATEINKGSLFYFFPAKSDLLFAIYLETFGTLDRHVDAIPRDLPADRCLAAHIEAMLASILAQPDHIAVYFQEHQWIEQSLSQDQAAVIRAQEKAFTGRLREVVHDGVRAGIFRRVNVNLLVTQLQAMIQSSYRWHTGVSDVSPASLADAIVETFYDGILRRAGGARA